MKLIITTLLVSLTLASQSDAAPSLIGETAIQPLQDNPVARSTAARTDSDILAPGGIPWEDFTPARLDEKLKSGVPVFIEFSAEWCPLCKTIEKSVLETEPVRSAFREKKVVPLKADLTSGDEDITQLLKSLGRTGIPTHVLYPGGSQQPIVLPEILTQETLLKELGALKERGLTTAGVPLTTAQDDDAAVPLETAVRELNEQAAADHIGESQPPLTEDAVIAAIRWELLNREKLEVSDETARVLEAIPQTRTLPKGFTLETDRGYEPNHRVTFEAWAVRLRIPGGPHESDGGSTAITISQRLLGSRIIGEEERKVIQAWAEKDRARGGSVGSFERAAYWQRYRAEREVASGIDRDKSK